MIKLKADESGAISALESVLRPIDRYAIAYRQTMEPIGIMRHDAWRKEVLYEHPRMGNRTDRVKAPARGKQLETSTEYVRSAERARMQSQ